MIHRLMCFLALIFSLEVLGQNLIPNPSFEDTICQVPGYNNPYDWPFFSPALHWFNPNDATPDCYSVGHDEDYQCGYLSIYDTDVQNSGEWQYPKEGERMIGLWCGDGLSVSRDLLEAELLEPMQADTEYCFSMYVSLGDSRNLAIDRLGAFFSMDSVYDHNWAGGFDLAMYVGNPAGVFLTDTAEWMHIEGTYTAYGGERFILIGNAFDDSETSYLEVDGWGPGNSISYYYVDELSLVPCSLLSLTEGEGMDIAVWAIGNSGIFVHAPIGTAWNVFDLSGRLLWNGETRQPREEIHVGDVSNGIYLFQWSHGIQTGTQKLYLYH